MKRTLSLAASAALILGIAATASLAQERQMQPTQPPTQSSPPSAPTMRTEPKQPAVPTPPTAAQTGKMQMQAHSCSTTRTIGQTCTCADRPGSTGRVERSTTGGPARCVVPHT